MADATGPPGPVVGTILYAGAWSLLILLSFVDVTTRRIPSRIVYAATCLAILGGILRSPAEFWRSLLPGGILGFGLLWLAYLGGKLFLAWARRDSRRPAPSAAFGLGDVRLGLPLGLLAGVPDLLVGLALGVLLAGAAALAMAAAHRAAARRTGAWASLPYAPFLVLGALMAPVLAGRLPL
jgi:leader peptidase (prepilin peptidase)/N-methyltransferase